PGEVTELLPPVGPNEPRVDLSDRATAQRASAESRGQAPGETYPPDAYPTEQYPVAPDPYPGEDVPIVDLSRRPTSSSPELHDEVEPTEPVRAPRRRPLEPTPDVSGAFQRISPQQVGDGTKADRKAKARRAATTTGRILVSLACVLALVGTGFIWNLKRGWNSGWNQVNALVGDDSNIRNKEGQNGDETYLIVGTDSRAGKNNSNLGGGDSTTIEGARSDTVLLVNVPADRSRVVAVSWPRDLQVDRPDCQQWDFNTAKYGDDLPGEDGVKLNSIYADGGPTCLVKTLQQMSGLNINHFIAMDFEGFEQVVKAVGGVTVCSTVPLYDYELGYILKKPGTKKLTGRAALQYVRARNISAEGNGDYGRIKRQQLFMSSLLRSTLSSDVLSNPAKLNKIVNTFIKYSYVDGVNTDSLIQLAESMQGLDAGAVTFITIPTSGTTTDGSNNEIPRLDDIDAIFNAIIDDKPLPGESHKKKPSGDKKDSGDKKPPTSNTPAPNTPSRTDATAQSPSNVTVRVLNGSGTTGIATDVMNKMVGNGFNVPGVADASSNRDDTVVRYGPGQKDAAATVAAMVPGARIQEDRTVKVGVELILGSDFQGTASMESVPAQGSTVSVGQLPATSNNSDLPNDLAVTNAGDTTCQ
ncbi:MAG: LCP family protein, partial [Gordonia sp. (in: high G+C Gram-positive bacteria)]